METCSVDGCGSRVTAKGLCGKHYQRQLHTGTTEPRVRLADELCSCGQRFAQYQSADGKVLDHPLCQPCYRRMLRLQGNPPAEIECARCSRRFTSRSSRAKYCSRECKDLAASEDGRNAEAATRSYYKRRYGLTPEQVAELRTNATCAICGGVGTDNGRWGNLVIDHDHKTGKVRGVLCSECNNGIGKFRDDPALIRRAIDYLARTRATV